MDAERLGGGHASFRTAGGKLQTHQVRQRREVAIRPALDLAGVALE